MRIPSPTLAWLEQYLIPLVGAAVAALGLVVLIGWHTHSAFLVQLAPALSPMQRNAAGGFVLCGMALLFSTRSRARFSRLCGLLAATIGALTLLEYLTGVNLGVDLMLGTDYVNLTNLNPGRPSLSTAICLTLCGFAINLAWSNVGARARSLLVGIAGTLVTAIALATSFRYLVGSIAAFGWTRGAHMAVHSAAALIVLGLSLIAQAWKDDYKESKILLVRPALHSPAWLPLSVGIAAGTILIGFWRGLLEDHSAKPGTVYLALLLGIVVSAFLFSLTVFLLQRSLAWATDLELANFQLRDEIRRREQIELHLKESQARQEAILESASEAIISTDSQCTILSFNSAAERIFGWTSGEAIGLPLALLMAERFRKACCDGIKSYPANHLSNLLGKTVSLVGLRKDGNEFPLEFSLASWTLENSTFFTAILRDITERKQIEDAFHQSEERVRLLLDSTSQAIYGIDLQGNCTFVNPACVRMFGYDSQVELLGKNLHALTHHTKVDGTPYPARDCKIYTVFHHGLGVHSDDEVLWRKNGTSFPVEYWAYPMRREGKLVGSVVAFFDITTRKQAEERLAIANEQLEIRVAERTDELGRVNLQLEQELAIRQTIEMELKEARNHYRLMTETLPQIVWTARPDGWLDYYNQRWFEYTGMTPEQSQGWSWETVLCPDDLAKTLDRWNLSLATGELFEIEYRLRRASDGSYRWYLGRAVPWKDSGGRIIKWLGTATDVDDKKRAREALQQAHHELEKRVLERTAELNESNVRLKTVLDSATQVSIIAFDTQGLITMFNKGAEQMLGYSTEEMVGKATPATIHFGPEVKARGEELSLQFAREIHGFEVFSAIAARESFEEREWTYVRKDGSRFTANVGVTMLRDWQGNHTGYLAVGKDITDRRLVEDELKSALQMKSDFVSFATHQLRTPLAGIKWLLELAAHDELSAEPASLIQDARDAADRLICMVNDLLDISRLERGKLILDTKNTDLGLLTQSVLADVSHQIQSLKHELSVCGGDIIPHAQVDPQLFRQVILNLVSNALKYTPTGGKISIEMSRHFGSIQWSICDNGIGIPKAAQAHLFEKFFRADNVLPIETEGTGLGLYLVRLIVELSGGKIWCDSEEGQGTTFKFELPIKDSE